MTVRAVHLYLTVIALSIYAVTGNGACDEVPELVTDRPDQTESSVVVPRGSVQVETGMVHTKAGENTVTELPGTLFRIGLHNRVELRIGTEGWVIDEEMDTVRYGDSDMGAKIFLWGENGWIPETALLAGVCIPTAKKDFSSKRFDPELRCACSHTTLRWASSHTLSDRLSLGYNVAVAWECSENENGNRAILASMPYSIVCGIGLSDALGTYIEFFGDTPINAYGGTANLIDGGFTYLVTDTFQLDISGGFGISDEAEDWFIASGISYRIQR